MAKKKNSYGLDPYMYDDPYTILAKAQFGMNYNSIPWNSIYQSINTFPYAEPKSSDFRTYREFKDAYDKWVIDNSTLGAFGAGQFRNDTVNVRQPQVSSSDIPTVSLSQGELLYPELNSYAGPSVVDFLKSINTGQLTDYKSRKKLAKALGITNYKGRPDQNAQLINLIRQNPELLYNFEEQEEQEVSPTAATKSLQDSVAVNIPIVDSTGNVIDTASNKLITKLPKSTDSDDEEFTDLEKAIAAISSAAVLGGGTYMAVKEIKDVVAKQYGLSGNNLKIYNEVLKKKLMPKVRASAKEADALGKQGKAIYEQLEDLFKETVDEARKYKDMTPEERVNYDLLEEQRKINKATPREKSFLRALEKEAPKGTPRLTIPNTPSRLPKPTAPSLPKPTGSYQKAVSFITSSKPFQKSASYLDELSNTAKNLKNMKGLKTAANFLRRFRFQEGGEQQAQMMQQVVNFIITELGRKTDISKIAEQLTTFGISQSDAIKLIEKVSNEISTSQYKQPMMAGSENPDEQGYYAATDERMPSEEEAVMMRNGGGYSGTYDIGSGSYFQTGGSFVPTYGDILPQYMYGSDYDIDSYMQNGGSLSIGDTLDISPEQMEYLRQQGYDFDII